MINADTFKSLLEVMDYFKDESTCTAYLEQQRWGDKVCCPHCGHDKVYRTNRGFKCAANTCYKKFTAISGTPFENTKIKLRHWFAAMYLISAHKKGISSYQIGRDLNICQKSAWFMNHRIRVMFQVHAPEKLSGVLEIDETFVGGESKNKHENKKAKNECGGTVSTKTPVLGMIERGGEVIAHAVPTTEKKDILPVVSENVEPMSIIMTDQYSAYNDLGKTHFHESVNHSAKEYVRGMVHTNGIENFWSHFQRGIIGVYHHISVKHLDRYCVEYAYRYNTRKITNEQRFHVLLQNCNGNRLTYKNLVGIK
jgi:transposase-like protein